MKTPECLLYTDDDNGRQCIITIFEGDEPPVSYRYALHSIDGILVKQSENMPRADEAMSAGRKMAQILMKTNERLPAKSAKAKFDVDGNPIKPPKKCAHCGQIKMKHKAKTFNCPIGKGNFPNFDPVRVFSPKGAAA